MKQVLIRLSEDQYDMLVAMLRCSMTASDEQMRVLGKYDNEFLNTIEKRISLLAHVELCEDAQKND